MIIDMNKKPWSCLKIKTTKKQLIEKKFGYETCLAAIKTMRANAETNASRVRLSNRFNCIMHKLKAINRRIILLEREETK